MQNLEYDPREQATEPEAQSRRGTFSLRQLKELFLGRPAKKLAEWGVTPNMVTGLGLGMKGASIALRLTERSKPEAEQRAWVFWSAIGLSLGSLVMDGLDGSVYRARKSLDDGYTNGNGQLVDGLTDRFSALMEMVKEVLKSVRDGHVTEAQVLAFIIIFLPLPSFLRAKIEENGGTVVEQSFNPLTFGGTHVGRTLIIELLSLEKVQLDQMLGIVGVTLSQAQFDAWRTGLITYLAVSNGIVVSQRAWGWWRSRRAKQQQMTQDAGVIVVEPVEEYHDEREVVDDLFATSAVVDVEEYTLGPASPVLESDEISDGSVKKSGAAQPLDSAGLAKSQEDHRVRAFWYGVATLVSAGSSAALLWWIHRHGKAT